MSSVSSTNDYGGIQPNNTSYIKQFFSIPTANIVQWIYKVINGTKFITLPDNTTNIYISQSMTVMGSINSPSDINLKENVHLLKNVDCDSILKLNPIKYNLINDKNKSVHFGLSAQELETLFPELVTNNYNLGSELNDLEINADECSGFKTINYLELIPLLIVQIKNMQTKIDELEKIIKSDR